MFFERFYKRRNKSLSEQDKVRPSFNLQLDITYECNLTCRHCYQRSVKNQKSNLTFIDWRRTVDQFRKLTKMLDVDPVFLLSGGEPLLSSCLNDIISYINPVESGCKVILLTNGSMLDDNRASFLKENNVTVQIRIDGPDPETHNYYRGNNAFEMALKGVDSLKEKGATFLFQAVLQKGISRLIAGFFKLAQIYGASFMNFTRLIPPFKDEYNSCCNEMLIGNDLREAYEKIVHFSNYYGVATNTNQPLWCLVDPKLGHPSSAGYLGLTVSPNGDI